MNNNSKKLKEIIYNNKLTILSCFSILQITFITTER